MDAARVREGGGIKSYQKVAIVMGSILSIVSILPVASVALNYGSLGDVEAPYFLCAVAGVGLSSILIFVAFLVGDRGR